LYAREREQRRSAAPLVRFWGVIQDVTLGYGYRPWRALAWLAVLLIAGSITFALKHPPPPMQPGTAPHFNPVFTPLTCCCPWSAWARRTPSIPPEPSNGCLMGWSRPDGCWSRP